ncbi:MAG TPA: phosphate ABC transporter substrate-binding protein PstS [Acidobacteriaceae bacterium]|nr:phosphate ABC transporter substrate-binding protein PstS [Acidobacteriaceae bacterium]
MSFVSNTARVPRHRSFLRSLALTLALAATALFGVRAVLAAQSVNVLETGSSLLYPLFNLWVPVYGHAHPDVKITTQSTGSGTGIAQSTEGLAQIGASDAYLSDALMRKYPTMLNIPTAISMQMVNYNLPGLNHMHIKLSGPVLAGIYQGKITKWNDSAIRAMNPGVNLPDRTIIPIHRSDGSGDTFIFTQYLAFSTPDWANSLAYGTTVSWPAVSGGLGAVGNPGMVTALKDNPYSVAYIGSSYQDAIDKDGMGIARLKNKDGNFVLPTAATAMAAANEMVPKTPKDERISLIFAPGAQSYPIINYEYALVNSRQPSSELASALRALLDWGISRDGGNAQHFMMAVHFVALPPSVVQLSKAQIAEIH